MIKICNKCGVEKYIELFFKDKTKKDGYRNQCKECEKIRYSKYNSDNIDKIKKYREDNKHELYLYNKEYYQLNKSKLNESSKKYYQNNKSNLLQIYKDYYRDNKESKIDYQKLYYKENSEQIKSYQIQYRKENKKKISEKLTKYVKERKSKDPLFHLLINIRGLLGISIRNSGFIKSAKTISIIGCSISELKTHLESKFEPWMTWENYGKYNGEFNYGWDIDHIIPISSSKTEDDLVNLNHYTNLQPLCSKINRYIKKDNI
jgi:hypothetical protein